MYMTVTHLAKQYGRWLAVAGLVIAGVALAGCGGGTAPPAATTAPAPTVKEIVVGEVEPLTGVQGPQGKIVHDGIQYAIDEANAAGGINGIPVTLLSRDDESKPEQSAAAARELITQKHVVALMGEYVDTLVGATSEVAEENKVPYLASSSLDERLTARGYHYFFRMSKLSGFSDATVGLATDVLHAKKVAILHASTPGATQTSQRIRDDLVAKGVEVPVFEKFVPGKTTDFVPLLNKAKAAGVDLIVSAGFTGDNVNMVRQLQANKIDAGGFLVLYGASLRVPTFKLGDAANYTFHTAIWDDKRGLTPPGSEEMSAAFAKGFQEKMGRPAGGLEQHGYSTGKAILLAIQNTLDAGLELTPENVRDQLAALDVPLPLEHLTFDENGDPLFYQQSIMQIQGDKEVIVWPEERADGKAIFPIPAWAER